MRERGGEREVEREREREREVEREVERGQETRASKSTVKCMSTSTEEHERTHTDTHTGTCVQCTRAPEHKRLHETNAALAGSGGRHRRRFKRFNATRAVELDVHDVLSSMGQVDA